MPLLVRLLVALALSLPLTACGFKAPAPHRSPPLAPPVPPLSTVSAELAVPADKIGHLLDARTENHLADIRDREIKCAIGRCHLTLLATREGPIQAAAQDGKLELQVPFGLDASVRLPGFLSMLRAGGNAEGIAFARTTARVTRQWQLRTQTDAHIELKNSRLRIGPLETDLTDVLNTNQEILSRPLAKMLDREIASNFHLHDQVAKVWARAFVPIRIAKKPVTWLVLSPQALRLQGPSVGRGNAVLSLALDVRARVVTQNAIPLANPRPLPAPRIFTGAVDRFDLQVPATVRYDEASRLALDALQRRPPRHSGLTVRFTGLEIFPSRSDVVVEARFCIDQPWDPTGWFASCGTGYLRGVPEFDEKNQVIRVSRVHYDLLTEDAILGAIHALAGPELGRVIQSRLRYPVSPELARLRAQITTALAKPQGRNVEVSGNVESFGQPRLTWTAEGFLVLMSAKGTVHVDLHF